MAIQRRIESAIAVALASLALGVCGSPRSRLDAGAASSSAARTEAMAPAVRDAQQAANRSPRPRDPDPDTVVDLRALEEHSRALERDPADVDARLGRARVAAMLGLTQLAIEDLRHVRAETWSGPKFEQAVRLLVPLAQARKRLDWPDYRPQLFAALDDADTDRARELVAVFPQAARLLFEDELLPAWAGASSPEEAEHRERRAVALGVMLAHDADDPFTADVASTLAATPDRDALAAAYLAFKRARALYESQEWGAAAETFARAEAGFGASASPSALSARVYRAVCLNWLSRSDESRALLRQIEQEAEPRGYRSVVGRAVWMRALVDGNGGELDEVQPLYARALTHFEATRQLQDQAAVHFLLSEHYAHLGERRLRYEQLGASLGLVDRISNPRWRHSIFNEAGDAARALELPRAALLFLDVCFALSVAAGNPRLACEARITRIGALVELGELDRAEDEAEQARQCAQEVSDLGMRDRLLAQTRVATAAVSRVREPARAVAELDQAISYFAAAELETFLPPLLRDRGMAYLADGDVVRARQDFESSVAELERQRLAPRAEQELRMVHFDQARVAFDRLIELAIDAGDLPRALALSERSRPRDVSDRTGGDGAASGAVDLAGLRARLDERTAILAFHVLAERTAVFVLTRGGLEMAVLPVGASGWSERVGGLLDAIAAHDDTAARRHGAGLHRALLGAVAERGAGRLAGIRRLVVVLDRTLEALPFAALVDPDDHRFLVEHFEIAMAPSLGLLGRERLPRARPRGGLLAVGDPALGPFRRINPLGHARLEVEALPTLEPDATCLVGERATAARFLALAGKHRIVYFAGHALAGSDPFSAYLLFAPDPETGDDALSVRELYRQSFAATELVMLAGCRTSEGGADLGAGVVSLARPFLAAGVPMVVGTLWNVDDRATSALFARIHRHLAAGIEPAVAIRRAQLAAIADPAGVAVADWAGIRIIRLDLETFSSEEIP